MCHEGVSDLPVRLVVPPQPWKVTYKGGEPQADHERPGDSRKEMEVSSVAESLKVVQAGFDRLLATRQSNHAFLVEIMREEQELRLRHEAYVKGRKKIK